MKDLNELSIENFLRKEISKELSNIICMMFWRSKRDTVKANCFDRISFFDKLQDLSDVLNISKVAMPRKWDSRKDEELWDFLLKEGFSNATENFGLTEDVIVKRFEMMFRSISKTAEYTSHEQ